MLDKINEDFKILNKNNLLIKANYNLSFVENRFYLTILFNMQKTARGSYVGIIPKEEFLRLSGKTSNNTTTGITRILESLANKRVQIQEFKKQNKKPSEYDFPIITGHKFNPKDNTYTIELSTILYDLLLEYMEVGYTPLNLNVLLGLNNFYAQRIYELLRLWSGNKENINYTVDYLRECFDLGDKYPRYNNFKDRVIEPALESLNSTEKFKITYEELKVGRRVDSITFLVEDLEKRKYFDKKEDKNTIEYKNKEKNGTVELLENECNINESKNEINVLKKENNKFYIPDEEIFTKGSLMQFKRNFKDYDFSINNLEDVFFEACAITIDKDQVDIIDNKSYKFFKPTLQNLLNTHAPMKNKDNYNDDIVYKKTKFHNFNENFTQYSEDELNSIIDKSQREKFR